MTEEAIDFASCQSSPSLLLDPLESLCGDLGGNGGFRGVPMQLAKSRCGCRRRSSLSNLKLTCFGTLLVDDDLELDFECSADSSMPEIL